MSAHSAGGGSPSVRQLIARYQSIDSSSSSPRPTVPSPRPAETRSPRHARRGFASQEHERAHKSENRPLLEAINDVFYGSDGSRTSGVAQMPPSPSYPDIIASSVSEEDISTGSQLSRDKNSPVQDRNIRKLPWQRHRRRQARPRFLLRAPRSHHYHFAPRVLPPLAAEVDLVDTPSDFAPFSQRSPPTPPRDESDLVSLSPPTHAVSPQELSFFPTRSSTPFPTHHSPPDHPVEDKYMAAARRAITLESRLPSPPLSTHSQPTRTLSSDSSILSPTADTSFPFLSDTSIPYVGVRRLKNLLRGPKRMAPPNTPSASPVRRFLQRRAEQESRPSDASYEDDRDDSAVSEVGRARPPGRLEMRDSPDSHHLAAWIAETSILTYSHVSFQTDFSPSPFPLHRKYSSSSFRERDISINSLPAPETLAELSIPRIRFREMDESFVASLERSLVLEMRTSEVGGRQGLPQALETLWEYGSESSPDDGGEGYESLGEEVLSQFPGWGPLDEFRIAMLRLAWK
ncbi:hypothetical protein EHS25_005294 [Saitozyma podzolica]|uniref:Uncharacterized protein n=1 Tax=Saitozyma podzolica TaxID=1890683 RepID=A0A427XYX8_9TREE|nr:hypothetical protein EHS25_005294 [Saitozyma podzolica]